MNREADPYAPPLASAAVENSFEDQGHGWTVSNGSLWVREGADLPDLCLYGSKPGSRIVHGETKLAWILPRFVALSLAIVAAGAIAMLLIAWEGKLGVFGMTGVMMTILFTSSLIPIAVFGWKNSRDQFAIRTSWGARKRERLVLWSLAFITTLVLIFGSSIFMSLRLGLSQNQKIGSSMTVMLLMSFFPAWAIRWAQIHAAEKRGDWFRLAGVAPAAIAQLEKIQRGTPPT